MVLQRIKREDPTAKAIVFVQWHDIEARVAAALEAHGIPYLWLEGHHSTTSESQSDFKCVCVCVLSSICPMICLGSWSWEFVRYI